ncbi:MAG: ATPase, T2SS/T4P/T4SS family, partial [Candidatus Omnitrophota bacterium]
MSLSERFKKIVQSEAAPENSQSLSAKVSAKVSGDTGQKNIYQEIKSSIHRILIDELDIGKLAKLNEGEARAQVRTVIEDILSRGSYPLNLAERNQIIEEVEDETFGLGPLEPLLHDPTVDDILVNSPKKVYVERFGKLELTDIVFKDEAHLLQVIDRIVSKVGRRIDESSPMVDARLADGSRVNAIIHPLVLGGPVLSIRRFKKRPLTAESLLKTKTLSEEILAVVKAAVKAKLNILISGGTGSGKTTLLNVLSGFIPSNERIVTIEDTAELQLQQEHVIRLEVRPANIEGKGEVTQRDLVRNALRMRPDRIIIG